MVVYIKLWPGHLRIGRPAWMAHKYMIPYKNSVSPDVTVFVILSVVLL